MKLDFRIDHPAPTPGSSLALRALLRVTGDPPERQDRTRMNLALVLDRSGSMSGEPLERAREAAELLLRRIWAEDLASVVTYDQAVETLSAGATGDAHQEVRSRLASVGPGGTTNLSGGWMRGRDLVEEFRLPDGVNRVMLLTDGLANQGITDPHLLCELCRAAAAKGITTTTIGMGPSFNEDLLAAMADAGGGSSYYVENPDQAPGIFEEEVEGLLSLAAQNVRVAVSPGAAAELVAVRHSYPSSRSPEGITLELGDLYAREPRLVLLEFRLGEAAPGRERSVAGVEVEGHVITPGGGLERRTIQLPLAFTLEDGPRVDPEITRVSLLLDAARARKHALDRRERGDWVGAREVLTACRNELVASGSDDAEVREEAADLEASAEMFSAEPLADADVKYMKQQFIHGTRSRKAARERIRRGGRPERGR